MYDQLKRQSSLYQQVWQMVALIPQGRVATYGQIARLLGKPGYARQVSYALYHRRRIAPQLSVPWHRVVNARGQIALQPTDWRFEAQKHRLQLEGVPVLGGQVSLKHYLWRPELQNGQEHNP